MVAGVDPATETTLTKASMAPALVPLLLLMMIIGSIFLDTLAISRFSLKIGVRAILRVLLFGFFINPSFTILITR